MTWTTGKLTNSWFSISAAAMSLTLHSAVLSLLVHYTDLIIYISCIADMFSGKTFVGLGLEIAFAL